MMMMDKCGEIHSDVQKANVVASFPDDQKIIVRSFKYSGKALPIGAYRGTALLRCRSVSFRPEV
jgi:hypothetical protein